MKRTRKVTMTPRTNRRAPSNEVEQELQSLKKLAKDLKRQLKKEYSQGAHPEELRFNLAAASGQKESLEAEIRRAKAQAKKRKKEISLWKNWFTGLTESDTSEEFQQLQREIRWRSKEIANLEAKIASLFEAKLNVEQKLEMTRLRLKTEESGTRVRTVDEDPRWLGLRAQIEKLEKERKH